MRRPLRSQALRLSLQIQHLKLLVSSNVPFQSMALAHFKTQLLFLPCHCCKRPLRRKCKAPLMGAPEAGQLSSSTRLARLVRRGSHLIITMALRLLQTSNQTQQVHSDNRRYGLSFSRWKVKGFLPHIGLICKWISKLSRFLIDSFESFTEIIKNINLTFWWFVTQHFVKVFLIVWFVNLNFWRVVLVTNP